MDNINKNDMELLKKKHKNLSKVKIKLQENYPIQYLIGHVDFYGRKIKVNKNVFIPRFETEYLVEKSLKYIDKLKLNNSSVLEIGTGSGCISIILKLEKPTLEITAIDINKKALSLAKKNAKQNKVKINFIYKNIFKYNMINTYDILISNPPYIKFGDIIDPKTKYEPQNALYADKTGLIYYRQIFKIAKEHLNKKHLIALEIEETLGTDLKKLAKEYFPKDIIKVEKDLTKKDRYIFIYS